MRRTLLSSAVAAALAAVAGCSLAMRSVPVAAPHVQWEALAGEWRGTYRMDGYDRHGTVAFKLVAIEEHASGEVLMIPAETGWPYTTSPPPAGDRPDTVIEPRSQLLTIRFVEAGAGTISGRMDPYWDPDRRCTAHAAFTGAVDGDIASGSITSECEGDARLLRGRWRVRRNPAVAEPR